MNFCHAFLRTYDFKKVIKELWNGLNNSEKVSANILRDADITIFAHEGVHLIRIKIPQADRKQRPVFIKGNPLRGTFRRNHDGDYHCSEEVIKQMLGDQANDTRDGILMEGFSLDDVNLPTLQVFRQHFTNRKPNHPFHDYDDKEFLRHIGGWGTDRHTKKECLTLAGLLMFGKLRSILDGVPNYIVDYQERPRSLTENRWTDRITTAFFTDWKFV